MGSTGVCYCFLYIDQGFVQQDTYVGDGVAFHEGNLFQVFERLVGVGLSLSGRQPVWGVGERDSWWKLSILRGFGG